MSDASNDNPNPAFDLGALLETAQSMQNQLAAAQEAQAEQTVTGSAGGGAVEIDAKGTGEFLAVRIESSVVDPDDVEMLSDLVLAALHDVSRQIAEMQESAFGNVAGGFDLGGLLGGGS